MAWLAGILVLTLLAAFIVQTDVIDLGFFKRDVHTRLGLDLSGGIRLVLQAKPQAGQELNAEQMEAARDILERRANGTGASEPVVQIAGSDRILVELPGIADLEEAQQLIQETAYLELISSGDVQLTEGTLVCTQSGCPTEEQIRERAREIGLIGSEEVAATPTVTSTLSTTGTVTAGTTPGTTPQATPVAVATLPVTEYDPSKIYEVVIRGDEVDGNQVGVAFDQGGLPRVTFGVKGDGPRKLRDFTASNVGKYMPIVLDKRVISSPQIQGIIPSGSGEINNIALADARTLSVQLRYGALPVSLTLLESQKISATLGQDAIDKSIIAGIIGLGLVMLFMLFYYRLPGALADVALIIYSLVAFAIFEFWPVTLTLAGIAGFILSIGMAVDANVLIFARLKEELRSGKTLAAAVEAGFDHAWPSIRDSNMSTVMTCLILIWFGSTFGGASIIVGFAITLLIGVLVSMFTAIIVTRTFLRAIVKTRLADSRWAFDLETRRPESAPMAEA
jgi:preprotein translocase subunit SecD